MKIEILRNLYEVYMMDLATGANIYLCLHIFYEIYIQYVSVVAN